MSTVVIDTFCTGDALTGEPFICNGPPAGPSWAAEDSKGFLHFLTLDICFPPFLIPLSPIVGPPSSHLSPPAAVARPPPLPSSPTRRMNCVFIKNDTWK